MEHAAPLSKKEFLSHLETIKVLETNDFETYSVVKDRETGQHYLHYSFMHIKLSEGGRRDDYEHFMPLSSDDVLGFLFGELPYRFPDHWKSTYYRSGTDDRLMPFDPSENHGLEKEAETELALLERLEEYKRQWEKAPDKEELTKNLFHHLDKLLKKEEDN